MLTSKKLSIGLIGIITEGGLITRLLLPNEAIAAPTPSPGSLEEHAFVQIEEYLNGERRQFELPLAPLQGSLLQRKIMLRLCTIPYGHTATYGSLGPARTVGSVCAANPLPIIRPCHRVIPAHNPPGNYRGGSELKLRLLRMEASSSRLRLSNILALHDTDILQQATALPGTDSL